MTDMTIKWVNTCEILRLEQILDDFQFLPFLSAISNAKNPG